MIIDLALSDSDAAAGVDVCVIGAGIAGLVLASTLRSRGIQVAVLESGPATLQEVDHPLNRVVSVSTPYNGGNGSRARCLGGTSRLWGGALIPFLEEDLEERPYLDLPSWPVSFSELKPFLDQAEKLFRVDEGPFDGAFVEHYRLQARIPAQDPDFLPRFAKWPTFKRRNVASLLGDRLKNDGGLSVWVNATATDFERDTSSGRLHKVEARAPNGRKLSVNAQRFVVCAGAIETTRLLLLMDRRHDGSIFAGCDALGRYFHDHVSLPAARMPARQTQELNRMAGFRFVGNTMRSLRFELSPAAQREEGVASAFAHISFMSEEASAFDSLRQSLRTLQKDGRFDPADAVEILRDVPYLVKAGYWRFIHRQLLWPSPSRYELHVVAEQLPKRSNQIALASETDAFGCELAAIDWRVEGPELETIRRFAKRFECFWQRHRLDGIAGLDWLIDHKAGTDAGMKTAGNIYHPGGTTRMGRDARTAVTDANLRTFAISNLWLASSSVFPTGASANPTFMILGFALRLAAHLATPMCGV